MSLPLLSLPTYQVGPVPFRVMPFGDAVASVIATAQSIGREGGVEASGTVDALPGVGVHFANAYTIALADSDGPYAQLLARPRSVVFTDGVPVAWVGKRAYPLVARDWDRVYGPDVMTAVLGASGPQAPRHYLLGGSPETLEALQSAIAERWPSAVVVGAESPRSGRCPPRRSRPKTPGSGTRERPSSGSGWAPRSKTGKSPGWPTRCRWWRWRWVPLRLPGRDQAPSATLDADIRDRMGVPPRFRAQAPGEALLVG